MRFILCVAHAACVHTSVAIQHHGPPPLLEPEIKKEERWPEIAGGKPKRQLDAFAVLSHFMGRKNTYARVRRVFPCYPTRQISGWKIEWLQYAGIEDS